MKSKKKLRAKKRKRSKFIIARRELRANIFFLSRSESGAGAIFVLFRVPGFNRLKNLDKENISSTEINTFSILTLSATLT